MVFEDKHTHGSPMADYPRQNGRRPPTGNNPLAGFTSMFSDPALDPQQVYQRRWNRRGRGLPSSFARPSGRSPPAPSVAPQQPGDDAITKKEAAAGTANVNQAMLCCSPPRPCSQPFAADEKFISSKLPHQCTPKTGCCGAEGGQTQQKQEEKGVEEKEKQGANKDDDTDWCRVELWDALPELTRQLDKAMVLGDKERREHALAQLEQKLQVLKDIHADDKMRLRNIFWNLHVSQLKKSAEKWTLPEPKQNPLQGHG